MADNRSVFLGFFVPAPGEQEGLLEVQKQLIAQALVNVGVMPEAVISSFVEHKDRDKFLEALARLLGSKVRVV